MNTIDMLEECYEYADYVTEETCFDPSWYSDPFGYLDEESYNLKHPINDGDYYYHKDELTDVSSTCTDLTYKCSKYILCEEEYKLKMIFYYLFLLSNYYDYKQRTSKKRYIEIKSILEILPYMKRNGFSFQYWKQNIFLDNRIILEYHFVYNFYKFLKEEGLWKGTGLWEFIKSHESSIVCFINGDISYYQMLYNVNSASVRYLTGDSWYNDSVNGPHCRITKSYNTEYMQKTYEGRRE